MKTLEIKGFKGKWEFLSNFYPVNITYKEITYPSVEHFYVAMKTNSIQKINNKEYSIKELREYISTIQNAGKCKRFGKKIKLRNDWHLIKNTVMYLGVKKKFTENNNLKNMLLSTNNNKLIETNYWHDNYWGDCECGIKPKCEKKGKNILGRMLMKLRSQLT